ncbi:MAG: hypothetical protein WDM87_00605 [Terracidiphilus sp.]
MAVSGQAGQVSAMAGIDPDRVRDAAQSIQAQGGPNGQGGDAGQGGLFGGYGGGGGFGGNGEDSARAVEVLVEEAAVGEAVEGETSATSIPASHMGRSLGTVRPRTSTRSHLRCWARNRTNPSTGPITLRSHS